MSGPLLTTALTRLRAANAAQMPDTCQIVATNDTVGTTGGRAPLSPTAGPPVACRVTPGSYRDTETVRNEQLRATTDWTISFPDGTVVTTSNRIRTGGKEFLVRSVDAIGSYRTAVRAIAVLVE